MHSCNKLVRKCAAVSAYSSAVAGSMCRDVAFAVEAHRRSPRKPTSFLAASRGRDGSPIGCGAFLLCFRVKIHRFYDDDVDDDAELT